MNFVVVVDTVSYHVKRCPRNKLKDLIQLQSLLIEAFFINQASVGSCIAEDSTWKLMEKTIKLLPTLEGESIDINKLSEDYEQLCKIFFTTSISDEGEVDCETLSPSLISKLHNLDYATTYSVAASKAQAEMNKKKAQLLSQLETGIEQSPVVET